MGSIPGLKRLPGEGNGNLFQYSCLGNSMDRRAWCATVHEPLHGSKPCRGKRVSVTEWSYGPCHARPSKTGHSEEFWQNEVHWRRTQQSTLVFLPREPHGQYEKAKYMMTEDKPSQSWGVKYTTREEQRAITFPGGSATKNLPGNARDLGLILRSGRSPGTGNGNLFQYSCLEYSMDRITMAGYTP